jgi:hypothetical protein
MSLLESQRVTFGVIRKTAYQDILKNCTKRFHVALLGISGSDYIVKIEAIMPVKKI